MKTGTSRCAEIIQDKPGMRYVSGNRATPVYRGHINKALDSKVNVVRCIGSVHDRCKSKYKKVGVLPIWIGKSNVSKVDLRQRETCFPRVSL